MWACGPHSHTSLSDPRRSSRQRHVQASETPPPQRGGQCTVHTRHLKNPSSQDMFIDLIKREREGGSETLIGCLPNVLRLGIEPGTFWCMG